MTPADHEGCAGVISFGYGSGPGRRGFGLHDFERAHAVDDAQHHLDVLAAMVHQDLVVPLVALWPVDELRIHGAEGSCC